MPRAPSAPSAAPQANGAEANGAPRIPADDHIFVDDVKKAFGTTQVIRGITMHLRRRETAVIIGGSGAGKTTLLRMLIGLERPSTGHIWVDGEDIGRLS